MFRGGFLTERGTLWLCQNSELENGHSYVRLPEGILLLKPGRSYFADLVLLLRELGTCGDVHDLV